jgi:uncharacterized protein YecE (DUF72 family)
VVEIQQTFHDPPRVQTAARWRQDSLAAGGPTGFEFTLKAWQLITHDATSPTYRRLRIAIPESQRALYGSFRPTDAVLEAWTRTVAVARALEARVVVFQCPARFTPTTEHTENLRAFFRGADRAGFRYFRLHGICIPRRTFGPLPCSATAPSRPTFSSTICSWERTPSDSSDCCSRSLARSMSSWHVAPAASRWRG